MSTQIAITTSDVPSTFCHETWQNTWPFLVGLLQASFAGELQTVNFGNTTPAATDRDKPWFRVNADGTPDGWYAYANGSWLRRYTGPDTGAIMLWDGAEATIATLDGGEIGLATLTTGPFWERVTAMDAKFPLGVGSLPISGTAVNVGDTGGLEKVALTTAELPAHAHPIKIGGAGDATGGAVIESVQTPDSPQGNKQTEATGSGDAHQNMPPYRGVFFIKRSVRIYHRAP